MIRVWGLDGGRVGNRTQVEGLVSQMREVTPVSMTLMSERAKWWQRLKPWPMSKIYPLPALPAPDMVIACGLASIPLALAAKRRYGAFTIYLQAAPKSVMSHFDAVICGFHDDLRGAQVLSIVGALNGVMTKDLISRRPHAIHRFASVPKPRVAVLIGGQNKAFSFSASDCQQLVKSLLAIGPVGIMATVSRRTAPECTPILEEAFSSPHFFYSGEGDNPYMDMLAAADYVIVTADSVNMMSEACRTRKPVFIYPLPVRNKRAVDKFNHIHNDLINRGCARFWQGRLEKFVPPLIEDATTQAANFVLSRYFKKENNNDQ